MEEPRPFGAYVLLEALGRGAMGDVHLARPYNPNRGIPTPVVIKRLHGELSAKRGFIARFRHEASIAVSVDSPHVAKVYDVGAVGDSLYIVMEYVPGWPLSTVLEAVLQSGQHASVPSVLDALTGALEGLHALHTAVDSATKKPLGIVHRDISPKNLMVDEDGVVRVIDLGLGKSNAQDWKTRTGVVMGSIGYIPPEQVAGEHVDHRADLYALGVVAFETLALRNYIKRTTLPEMMAESMSPRHRPVSQFRPDVPPALDAVLERLLRPKKEERYQSAAEVLAALRAIVPERRYQGELKTLVDELFGAKRRERERKLHDLLAQPLPVDEGVEQEPTEVFVQRAGVRPDEIGPGDTRVAPRPHGEQTEVAAATVATEVWSESSGSHRSRPVPLDTVPDAIVTAARDTLPPDTLPPDPFGVAASARFPGAAQPTRGVPLPVLVVSVVLAAALGAAAAVVLSRSVGGSASQVAAPARASEAVEVVRPVVPVAEKRPVVEAAARTPEPEEDAVEAGSGEVAPGPTGGSPAKKRPAVRPSPRAERTDVQVERAPEVRPKIEDELAALLARTDALIKRLPDGPRRTRAMQLKLDLRRDQGAADPARREDTVRRAKTELADLEKE